MNNSFYIKAGSAALHDLLMIAAAYFIAVALRFEFVVNSNLFEYFYLSFAIVFVSQAISFQLFSLYRGVWRYSSTADLINIIKSVTFGSLASAVFLFITTRLVGFPRSVFLMDWFILIILLGGNRLLYRLWKDKRATSKYQTKEEVIIIGAGAAGEQLYREISQNINLPWKVVAFLDDNTSKKGRTLHGIKIFGTSEELSEALRKTNATKIFIAIPSANNVQIRKIVDICIENKIEFKILPSINKFLTEKSTIAQLRSVKPEDLLGREPISLNLDSMQLMLNDKTVLITGAGGSIGSELCRQVCAFNLKKLVLLDISELFLFNLERELTASHSQLTIEVIVADIRDNKRLEAVFELHKPEVVLHAAALKHVPMMEANPEEAVKTNICGTLNVAKQSGLSKVSNFVMISTDKAVNPTNTMGTTKRIAEMVCTQQQSLFPSTKYITVRFGNVLGSNGSVIPIFKDQIENGGPITITDPQMTRYFMSIPEASQLVLEAATLGKGGEIFVLDMGEPVKIVDLAKDMINLAGLIPDQDIKIKTIGLRPGEKLYEELFSENEELQQTTHPKVQVAKNRYVDFVKLEKWIQEIDQTLTKDSSKIKKELEKLVPEAKLS